MEVGIVGFCVVPMKGFFALDHLCDRRAHVSAPACGLTVVLLLLIWAGGLMDDGDLGGLGSSWDDLEPRALGPSQVAAAAGSLWFDFAAAPASATAAVNPFSSSSVPASPRDSASAASRSLEPASNTSPSIGALPAPAAHRWNMLSDGLDEPELPQTLGSLSSATASSASASSASSFASASSSATSSSAASSSTAAAAKPVVVVEVENDEAVADAPTAADASTGDAAAEEVVEEEEEKEEEVAEGEVLLVSGDRGTHMPFARCVFCISF